MARSPSKQKLGNVSGEDIRADTSSQQTTPETAKPEVPKAKSAKNPNSADKAKPKKLKSGEEAGIPERKPKLVRDSFTFPESDYSLIGHLKQRALNAKREVKKSEVLRAALNALAALSDASFLKALDRVERLTPGRPGK